ncbi:glycosyltransferase [Candidatus Pelagibacter sp.]|uniref:glycosyltransferase n=1 Tax=Candidatus Pelagibacter sp. TaxID=2024849 RepID=UPI003F86CC6F
MKKKFNIFIFHPYPSFGGADRSIIRLINSNKNAHFILISLTKCNYKKYLNKKIKYIQLSASRTIFSLFELRNIVLKLMRNSENGKNIFISNQNFANILTILSLKKIKKLKIILIERNHLDELYNYRNFVDFFKKKIILMLIKLTYKKADLVIGISKKLTADLSRFINKKVQLIYNPAMDEQLYKKNSDKVKLNKRILKKNVILNIGFFEDQKDQITVLKAFNLLKKEFKNIHLVLIGRGSKFNELKSYVEINKLSKDVSLLTKIDNPKNFYKIADLFVLSSKYEGFGNVIVEALKYNCPVITSNCQSGPMEIISKGKYGDFFNVGDYYQLKNKIKNFLIDKSKLKLKTIRAKNHLKKFSISKNKIAFDKLFYKI